MKQFLFALAVLSLPLSVSVRAESDVKVEEAKKEAKKLKNTVKKDSKKIVKNAKSENPGQWSWLTAIDSRETLPPVRKEAALRVGEVPPFGGMIGPRKDGYERVY